MCIIRQFSEKEFPKTIAYKVILQLLIIREMKIMWYDIVIHLIDWQPNELMCVYSRVAILESHRAICQIQFTSGTKNSRYSEIQFGFYIFNFITWIPCFSPYYLEKEGMLSNDINVDIVKIFIFMHHFVQFGRKIQVHWKKSQCNMYLVERVHPKVRYH